MSGRAITSPAVAGPLSALALTLLATACGDPTAQVVRPDDGPVSFELPVEYADIGVDAGEEVGVFWGRPDTGLESYSSDPVVLVDTIPGGETASFSTLRELATFGEFDPLDPEADLPEDAGVLNYIEIIEPEIWGVRLQLADGEGVFDFQALVERGTGEVVVSRVVCTEACFVEHTVEIDEIQTSWTLEP